MQTPRRRFVAFALVTCVVAAATVVTSTCILAPSRAQPLNPWDRAPNTARSANKCSEPMFRIILCGGQTGVDQAAHRAAQESNLLCAGWCPPNRECESGTIHARFPLQPTPLEKSVSAPPDVRRSLRTEWNVRDSDGTLIILPKGADPKSITDPGTNWTKAAAARYCRPLYLCPVCDESKIDDEISKVAEWACEYRIQTLNVAGPSEGTSKGIGEWAHGFLIKLFKGPASPNVLYKQKHPVALWLVPENKHFRDLHDLILRQATMHGTPSFYPHVTFLVGHLNGDRDEETKRLCKAVDDFCAKHEPLTVRVRELSTTPAFHRFLFRTLDDGGKMEEYQKAFMRNEKRGFFLNRPSKTIPPHMQEVGPHLSLMYSENRDTEQQSKLKEKFETEWNARKLPKDQLSLTEVWIVIPADGDWDDVKSWEVRHIQKLGPK